MFVKSFLNKTQNLANLEKKRLFMKKLHELKIYLDSKKINFRLFPRSCILKNQIIKHTQNIINTGA